MIKAELKEVKPEFLKSDLPPKIIAKTFFQELKKIGFTDKQILQLAAELISKVSKSKDSGTNFNFYRIKGLTKLPY